MSATGPKRTPIQRERALCETAQLYCQGLFQAQIAEKQGVTQQTISKDLQTIQRRWQAECVDAMTQGKARELARIDELERTYWAAWFESKDPKTSKATEKSGTTENSRQKLSLKEETRDGNPAFLQGVMTCIDKRCKLLGLDAPVKVDPGKQLVVIKIGDSEDDTTGDQPEAIQ